MTFEASALPSESAAAKKENANFMEVGTKKQSAAGEGDEEKRKESY